MGIQWGREQILPIGHFRHSLGLVVGTTSQNTPHHTTFPLHHMWCGDFPTKFYSCGVGGDVGCVEKIRVMWGVVWGVCKKYM